MTSPTNGVVVGRITAVYGVRGWVKIHSYTEQPEAIFGYQPWMLESGSAGGSWQKLEVDQWRPQGGGLVAHLVGVDDRDVAKGYCQRNIRVDKHLLPELDSDDFYWYQLQGLTVLAGDIRLGKVASLMETGANDVLVVRGDKDSVDREERLIPYADQFVRRIDLEEGVIEVDWDPEF